jgi:hypothetical protein
MIWLLYITADAIGNWWLIEKQKQRPNYMVLFIIRGIAAILYGAFVLDVTEETILMWFIFVTFSFPFPFNFLLNLLRQRPFDYYGAESGFIDRFIVKYKLHGLWFLITIIMFAIAVFVWARLVW